MPRVQRLGRIPDLSEFKRGRILGLRGAGFSVREITRRTNRSLRAILRCYQPWTQEGQEHRARGPGRRRETTARKDRLKTFGS